jgi:hypothetical protein
MKTRIILSFKTTETTLPATELSFQSLKSSTSTDSEPNTSHIKDVLRYLKKSFAYERQMSNFQNIR